MRISRFSLFPLKPNEKWKISISTFRCYDSLENRKKKKSFSTNVKPLLFMFYLERAKTKRKKFNFRSPNIDTRQWDEKATSLPSSWNHRKGIRRRNRVVRMATQLQRSATISSRRWGGEKRHKKYSFLSHCCAESILQKVSINFGYRRYASLTGVEHDDIENILEIQWR